MPSESGVRALPALFANSVGTFPDVADDMGGGGGGMAVLLM